MNLRPISNRIVVELCQSDDKTPGGLFIPPTAQEKSIQGKVISIGPGRNVDGIIIPMEIAVGNTIVYEKGFGIEFEIEGKKYTIIEESNVIAVID